MKMILMKWLFFLFVIPAIKGSLKFWKPKDSSLEERVTKKILETCYGDNDFEDLIFILGDFNEFFEEASVIWMNNLTDIDKDYELRQSSSIGVTKVLIIGDSPKRLQSDLILFRKTRWWNHLLPFLIIGKNDEKCANFKEMLNTTWRMDILNSIYICSESGNTTLYTLNPITNYAPDPWKRMEDMNDSNIYHQVFDSHTSCENLNYDKTKVLNGYQIKAVTFWIPKGWSNENYIHFLNNFPDTQLFQHVIRLMNASLIYKKFDTDPFGEVRYLNKRVADIMPWDSDRRPSVNVRILYLFPPGKSGQYVFLYKTRYLWSTHVLCGTVMALIILFLVLMIKNGEVTLSILDMIRFVTYASIRTDTRGNSFRMYFTTMLIFLVISNGVFQGQIAAFLTTVDKVLPIKTVEELEHLRYRFYSIRGRSSEVLSESNCTQSTLTWVDNADTCINYVLNGTLNACILPLDFYEENHRLKLLDHITQAVDIAQPNTLKSRPNWPLCERLNYILMRVIESGVFEYREYGFYRNIKRLSVVNHGLTKSESSYRPIELANLDFAFKLLVVGLSIAMFVLIIELRMQEI